jgi:hypothetical protein
MNLDKEWSRETHLTNAEGKRIIHYAKGCKELVREMLEDILPKMHCNVEAYHLQKDWCKRARAKLGDKDA